MPNLTLVWSSCAKTRSRGLRCAVRKPFAKRSNEEKEES